MDVSRSSSKSAGGESMRVSFEYKIFEQFDTHTPTKRRSLITKDRRNKSADFSFLLSAITATSTTGSQRKTDLDLQPLPNDDASSEFFPVSSELDDGRNVHHRFSVKREIIESHSHNRLGIVVSQNSFLAKTPPQPS